MGQDQHCGTLGKATACNASIPYGGCWLLSWLLYLPSNSLLMAQGKAAEDGPSVWIPATRMGDPDEAPGFSLASPGHCGCLASGPADGDLCLSLSVTLSK